MKPLSKVEAEDWAVLFETQVSLFSTVICKVIVWRLHVTHFYRVKVALATMMVLINN